LEKLQQNKEEVLRKRKTVFVAISIVLSCFAASDQLANASYPKPRPPVPPPESESGKTSAKVKVIKRMPVRLTAYYGPLRNQEKYVYGSYKKDVRVNGSGKITRSGKIPAVGMAAADWRVLPRGTKLRIPQCDVPLGTDFPKPASEIIFEVEDTGSAVKNRHIDIFAGFGDKGRKLAEKINDLQPKKFVIEVVEVCPFQ